jgi:hypothetical protein
VWVRFLEGFTYAPPRKPLSRRVYSAGMVENVVRDCGQKAIDRGAAVPCAAPPGRQTLKGGYRVGRTFKR